MAAPRRGGVGPTPGERRRRVGGAGAPPAMPLDDRLSRRVQVPSPPVEAQALPDGEDVIERGGRKIADRGEPFEEPLVVRRPACNPSPLEKVFGNQDSIGVSRAPPG